MKLFKLLFVFTLMLFASTALAAEPWNHGFLGYDDGTNHCGRESYYDVIGSNTWHSYSFDLMSLDPKPVFIEAINIGGLGWDFNGYWDNVSILVDGVEKVSDGSFSYPYLKGWRRDGGGRGKYLTDDKDIGGSHGTVFHYQRSESGYDGGYIRAGKSLNLEVSGARSVVVSGDVYLISHSLQNPGGWCCVYDCGFAGAGDYAGEIQIVYQTAEEAYNPDYISNAIQDLPDECFINNASNEKKTFANKLKAVQDLIDGGEYQQAVDKLLNDILPKVDGNWIDCPEADGIVTMVEGLIEYLER
jgi:hypothetical protein